MNISEIKESLKLTEPEISEAAREYYSNPELADKMMFNVFVSMKTVDKIFSARYKNPDGTEGGKIVALLAEEQKEPNLEQLANDITLVRLAEWIAIQNNETRLQADKYAEEAQELAEYLHVLGYRLIDKENHWKRCLEVKGETTRRTR